MLIFFKKLKTGKSGMTLIETLVAMAIFSIAMMISLSIFVNSQGLQQRTIAIQKGGSDARHATELIARKIRLGMIDYEFYNNNPSYDLSGPISMLALRDNNGVAARFRLSGGAIQICGIFDDTNANLNTNLSEDCTDENWVNITSNKITITRLDFYISPGDDPYEFDESTGEYLGGDQQEMVTMVIESTIEQNKGADYPTHFQTTVSSRMYKR